MTKEEKNNLHHFAERLSELLDTAMILRAEHIKDGDEFSQAYYSGNAQALAHALYLLKLWAGIEV